MSRKPALAALLGVLMTVVALAPTSAGAAPAERTATVSGTTSARATLTTAEFESRLLALVNARRAKVGCAKVRSNASLVTAARRHSARMAAAQNLSHQLPREATFAVRIVNAGYGTWAALAENIAWGPTSPARIYSLWINSAPHRANIQRCVYRDAGIGVVFRGGSPWVTLDLGRRR